MADETAPVTDPDGPKDFHGHPITVGCVIVYGHLLGRSGALDEGVVTAITEREENYWRSYTHKAWTIHIEKADIGYQWHPKTGECLGKVYRKVKTRLLFPNRMLVMPETADSYWTRKPCVL